MGCACCKKKDKSIDSNLLKDNMLPCKLYCYKSQLQNSRF